ncbi:MAG: hypothetical protein E6J65_12615 [Deltaproteobacteria bacterium]|nr:MAG: hypothetical protein E6J63_00580 [Deltaproteobacteria bacterium]TMB24479.1 MAG: hypothetical protein E6J65_12615 [Deltaproteobacteria bacterium]
MGDQVPRSAGPRPPASLPDQHLTGLRRTRHRKGRRGPHGAPHLAFDAGGVRGRVRVRAAGDQVRQRIVRRSGGLDSGADVRGPQEQSARGTDARSDRRHLRRPAHRRVGGHQMVHCGGARVGEEHPHLGTAGPHRRVGRQAHPPARLRHHAEQLGGPHRAGGLPWRAEMEPGAGRGPARGHRAEGAREDARPGDRRGRAERSARDGLHLQARHQRPRVGRKGAADRGEAEGTVRRPECTELLRRELPDAQRRLSLSESSAGPSPVGARQGVRPVRAEPRRAADRRREPHLHPAQCRAGRNGAEETRMSAFIAALLVAAALPDYQPVGRVSGTIRSSGNDQMALLLQRWEKGFRRFHPEVGFESWLKGTASGIYGLEMRTADLALMGRAMNPFEYYGTYERSWVFPVQVEVATGSFATPNKSPAYAVFVHRDNPVGRLTLQQLDGIFGAQRGGGWNGLSWDQSAARGPEQDIRTWGQLGATGAWADKTIHVFGPPLEGAGAMTYFQSRVMHGADLWNEDLREYADPARMIADLSNDPYGIAYSSLDSAAAGVKALPLAETAAGPYVRLTRETVADRSYPLSRPVYAVFTIDNEKSELAGVDPKLREFLRYVLSKQGQAEVVREGSYLPLTAAAAAEQMKKLDSGVTPPELRVIHKASAIKVRMSIDEDPIVVRLAESLGYFEQEGIELERVDVEKITGEDYLMQEPLAKGQIDAAYCWFNHAIYGARHGFPVQAVMLFNDAPGMKVLVADRMKGRIASAADFTGGKVAAGAGYGMKSVLTRYLARKAGAGAYTTVMMEKAGRQEAVVKGLKEGAVDVMTFQEPITSALLATGLATTLYDLNSGESTARALGAPFPAQALLMSPEAIAKHPEVAQSLVNALVRAMRFVNSHSAEEIAARLPADYFAGKDRRAEVELIRASLPTYARGDYSILPEEARLVMDVNLSAVFDESDEGRWRGSGDASRVRAADLYTNRFVTQAMNAIAFFSGK